MEDTYKNFDSFKRHGRKKYDSPTEPEIEDGVYMDLEQQHPNPNKHTASSSFNYKIIISTLGLLMLGALTALCAVGILYHYKVIFTEILSEKYKNATDTLVVLENRDSEKGNMYEMQKLKYQELMSVCNETERLYEQLKMKYKEAHERLSACSDNQNCKLCGEEWKPLGLKCYYFSTEKLSWEQSRDHCVKKGGHLVIITSQTEQTFASSQIRLTHWIGLNDLMIEGEWMWVNNQSLKETGVTFWYMSPAGISEPDNWKKEDPSGENCATLGHEDGNTHKWFDDSCRKLKQFICEK